MLGLVLLSTSRFFDPPIYADIFLRVHGLTHEFSGAAVRRMTRLIFCPVNDK